jgi:hypothetical protein
LELAPLLLLRKAVDVVSGESEGELAEVVVEALLVLVSVLVFVSMAGVRVSHVPGIVFLRTGAGGLGGRAEAGCQSLFEELIFAGGVGEVDC